MKIYRTQSSVHVFLKQHLKTCVFINILIRDLFIQSQLARKSKNSENNLKNKLTLSLRPKFMASLDPLFVFLNEYVNLLFFSMLQNEKRKKNDVITCKTYNQ